MFLINSAFSCHSHRENFQICPQAGLQTSGLCLPAAPACLLVMKVPQTLRVPRRVPGSPAGSHSGRLPCPCRGNGPSPCWAIRGPRLLSRSPCGPTSDACAPRCDQHLVHLLAACTRCHRPRPCSVADSPCVPHPSDSCTQFSELVF